MISRVSRTSACFWNRVNTLFINIVIIIIVFSGFIFAQGTWQVTMRTHPELEWQTLHTLHFNIHYHQGIEEIARKGAAIAEQSWPILLKQVGLDTIPAIDIIFTNEDEIMNGYALWTYTTFIWVDQNDAIIWLENRKWLNQVVSHELQHIFQFHALKTWIPEPWSLLVSGTPGWFIEGTAEYFTEIWRPYRADLVHKQHVLKNSMDKMESHYQGFSKMLYFADRFGDSALVKLMHERTGLKLFKFKKAFKKSTGGISLKRFEEDWRRQMNTYYYGYRSQKERIEEVGKTSTFPVSSVLGFQLSSDSLNIAIAGLKDKDQLDGSLYVGKLDTIKAVKKRKKNTSRPENFPKKDKYKWKLKEIDSGRIHSILDWSSDGNQLVYTKYHFGDNQSMVWDLRLFDLKTGKAQWLTFSQRAAHPNWSPDGSRIVYVAHSNNTSNLFLINPEDRDMERLTDYPHDTQILTPRFSPDGKHIAFAKSSPQGNTDIYLIDVKSGEESRLTDDPALEYYPVWHPNGEHITYTSHVGAGLTPNLSTLNIADGHAVPITDVADAVWARQWTPKGNSILASTLPDVDSVRIVQVNPFRTPVTQPVSIRESYLRWMKIQPDTLLPLVDPSIKTEILGKHHYSPLSHLKHLTSLAFPYLDGSGIFGFTVWVDALGKDIFQIGGGTAWDGSSDPWYFANYVNARSRILWSVNLYRNMRWNFRPYDRSLSGLFESLDGIQWMGMLPFNLGNALHSSHMVTASLSAHYRNVILPSDSLDAKSGEFIPRLPGEYHDLPIPEEGNEGIVSLRYRWLSRRPHKNNVSLPTQGFGLQSSVDIAKSEIYGDFSYTRFSLEGFGNQELIGPLTLFGRVKTQVMTGKPPAQDSLGLTRDLPVYYALGNIDLSIIAIPESHNPRGWDGVRLGDRLVFGSVEIRLPLLSRLPVNILGFTLGSVSGALFTDFGNVWNAGKQVGDAWIVTAGYELKVALQIVNLPLLHFAFGEGQTVDEWRDRLTPRQYARLALINPF
ncbi:MAG: BamA/TamA family outer membrane protein [Candidatus Neomarinimicrobiota bacterium]